MATEEFKLLTEELFENWLQLKRRAEREGFQGISISFKEYLDFYINYKEADEQLDDLDSLGDLDFLEDESENKVE